MRGIVNPGSERHNAEDVLPGACSSWLGDLKLNWTLPSVHVKLNRFLSLAVTAF
jgi:small subunit ribosomal protein S15